MALDFYTNVIIVHTLIHAYLPLVALGNYRSVGCLALLINTEEAAAVDG